MEKRSVSTKPAQQTVKTLPQARMEAAWRYMSNKRAQAQKQTFEPGNLFSPSAAISALDKISLPSVTNTPQAGYRNV